MLRVVAFVSSLTLASQAASPHHQEYAHPLRGLLSFHHRISVKDVVFAEVYRFLENTLLDGIQHIPYRPGGRRLAVQRICLRAREYRAGPWQMNLFPHPWDQLRSAKERRAFPVIEFESGGDFGAVIYFKRNADNSPFKRSTRHYCRTFSVILINRNQHNLIWRQTRRQHQPLVITVCHDNCSNKRVDNPQEVVQTYCCWLFRSRYWISNALAKF